MITISARRLKRYEAAENVAKAFRYAVTTPHYMEHERQLAMNCALEWTSYWLEFGSYDRAETPPPVPKQWKRNRDRYMGVPE